MTIDRPDIVQFSVVIPVYNAEAYVERAVRSALAEPETLEVVLVEDGSPDGALAVCERLAAGDARVRLLRHPDGENHGAGASRNLGIEQARGEWIAFLDADDFFLPGRLSGPAAQIREDSTIDGVYEAVGVHFESEDARQWWDERTGSARLTAPKRRVSAENLFHAMLHGALGGNFCTPGVVVRRELLRQVGGYDEWLRMCQDTHLAFRLAWHGRLVAGRLEEAVAMRGVHANNRVRDRRRHLEYHVKMWSDLVAWARRERVPRRYRQSLRAKYYRSRLSLAELDGRRDVMAKTALVLESRYQLIESCFSYLAHRSS